MIDLLRATAQNTLTINSLAIKVLAELQRASNKSHYFTSSAYQVAENGLATAY